MITAATTLAAALEFDEAGFQVFCDELLAANMRRTEDELRRLLGMWVSELEPAMVYDHHNKFIGLRPADWLFGEDVTLRAWDDAR